MLLSGEMKTHEKQRKLAVIDKTVFYLQALCYKSDLEKDNLGLSTVPSRLLECIWNHFVIPLLWQKYRAEVRK